MQDYLPGRYFSLKGADTDALDERLEAIATSFGSEWLAEGSNVRLQEFWARKDGLATCELVLFPEMHSIICSQ